jgi:hypothetical protein
MELLKFDISQRSAPLSSVQKHRDNKTNRL